MEDKDLEEAQAGMEELALVDLDGDLRAQFKAAREVATQQIGALLQEAQDKFKEACVIAERYGVPFETYQHDEAQQWTPDSFFERYANQIDVETGEELRDSWTFWSQFDINPYADPGHAASAAWTHSSIGC